VFAAKIDSGLIQEDVAEALRKEGINSEDDIRLIAKLGRWARSHRRSAGSCRRQKTGGCTLIRMVNSLAKGDELLAKNEDYHNCTTQADGKQLSMVAVQLMVKYHQLERCFSQE
jgi:hypothetical protein